MPYKPPYEKFREDLHISEYAVTVRKRPDNVSGQHPLFNYALSHIQDAARQQAKENGRQFWQVLVIAEWGGLEKELARLDEDELKLARRQLRSVPKDRRNKAIRMYVGQVRSHF